MMLPVIHSNKFGSVIFFSVQITCNACYTYDVPTESNLPVPVDLDFFIHLLVIVSIGAV